MGGADTCNCVRGVLSGLMRDAWAIILQKIRSKVAKKTVDAVHIHHNAPPRVTSPPHTPDPPRGFVCLRSHPSFHPPVCPTKCVARRCRVVTTLLPLRRMRMYAARTEGILFHFLTMFNRHSAPRTRYTFARGTRMQSRPPTLHVAKFEPRVPGNCIP